MRERTFTIIATLSLGELRTASVGLGLGLDSRGSEAAAGSGKQDHLSTFATDECDFQESCQVPDNFSRAPPQTPLQSANSPGL